MNNEQWTSLVRACLQVALAPGSYIVLRGLIPADQAQQLIVPLTAVITAVGGVVLAKWGVDAHSPAAVVAAVRNSPDAAAAVISAVRSSPAIASAAVSAVNSAAVPGVKVVAADSPSPQVIVDTKGTVKLDPAQPYRPEPKR